MSFSEAQKQYLQGFMAGVVQRGGLPFVGRTGDGRFTHEAGDGTADLAQPSGRTVFGTPVDALCRQERAKLEKDPMTMWDEVAANAAAGRFPEGDDVFRYKALGLFYVAPVQDAFMLRLRIPAGVLTAHQVRGVAALADRCAGGYADVTTRANLQLREIGAAAAYDVLAGLYDLGLTARGAGADNVRNITASPTAGFDPDELYDVRPLARAMHHYLLNSPDLYGLPRKFNIAFDGGGALTTAADTNDLAFVAVRVPEGRGVEAGVYFRIELGGVTGHGAFAQDTGFMVRPEQCVAAAAAVVRVYLEHGDRTNRKQARLKYLLERWGVEHFVAAVQDHLAFPLVAFGREACDACPPTVRHRHVGFHAQRQAERVYAGVVVPVGRLTTDQMRALAGVAERYGAGELRLTVLQNVLVPHLATADVDAVREALTAAGLGVAAAGVRSGLVACTGNAGCPYANTDTKAHARALGDYLEAHVAPGEGLDEALNLHFTGCPHSCAQHYCGDIGFLGTKMDHDGVRVEGYHIVVGGGMDEDQGLAREIVRSVPAGDVPALVTRLLAAYRRERRDGERFVQFTRRHDPDALRTFALTGGAARIPAPDEPER